MILASSWAELIASGATVVGAGAVPWGVYVYRADVRRRQQEREDNVSRQARLASVSVEPTYAPGTRLSPRIVGGLTGVNYAVVNGSEEPIKHVTIEIVLPWARGRKTYKTFDLIAARSEKRGHWDLGGDVLSLPKGQNELGRDDVQAVASLMDAGGLWWRIERGNPHPIRLLSPVPGIAPPFEPVHVRVLTTVRRFLTSKPPAPRPDDAG